MYQGSWTKIHVRDLEEERKKNADVSLQIHHLFWKASESDESLQEPSSSQFLLPRESRQLTFLLGSDY